MVKIVKIQVQRIDSSYNEDSKNTVYFFQRGPISGEGLPQNLGKWATTGTSIFMQILGVGGGVSFRKRILDSPPGIKIFVIHCFTYMSDLILDKNEKPLNCQSKNLISLHGPPLHKYS